MRTAFIEALTEAAARDPRIWLLCGDLGYSVLEGFAARFPDRFLNCGVAEQNMAGMAAGLASAGIEGALEGARAYVTNPELVSRTHFARFLVKIGRARSISAVFERYLTAG